MEDDMADNLIPTNGIHIIETYYPSGYNVARYDAEGFTADSRWFDTLKKAQDYARQLSK
jgi:hypothetical protein